MLESQRDVILSVSLQDMQQTTRLSPTYIAASKQGLDARLIEEQAEAGDLLVSLIFTSTARRITFSRSHAVVPPLLVACLKAG
jgi:hypothetical protein